MTTARIHVLITTGFTDNEMIMEQTQLLSVDELLDHAYEIFLELAADNLSAEQIECFNAEFEERGALGDSTPEEDWQDYIDFEIDPERHVEICIGLLNEEEEFDRLFARMLLSRHPDERQCQVQWQER
jgi:uncharacterized protein